MFCPEESSWKKTSMHTELEWHAPESLHETLRTKKLKSNTNMINPTWPDQIFLHKLGKLYVKKEKIGKKKKKKNKNNPTKKTPTQQQTNREKKM